MSDINPTTDIEQAAALVTEFPQLALVVRRAVDMLASVGHGEENARDLIVAAARAGLACGAAVTDYDSGAYAGVQVAFGPVRMQVYAAAEQVHHVTRRTVEQTDDGTTCRITEYTPRSILAEVGAEAGERAA